MIEFICSFRAFNNLFPQYKVKWTTTSMPFKQMENIAAFLKGLGQVPGIKSFDLFVTVDLFEGKNLEQVKRCLVAWRRAAEKVGNPLFTPSKAEAQEQDKKDQSNFIEPKTAPSIGMDSSVSDSGFEASRSNSYHSFEAVEAEESEASVQEAEVDEGIEISFVEPEEAEVEQGIEISFVEPEVILPPESPIENNFGDIDEPVIECVAE